MADKALLIQCLSMVADKNNGGIFKQFLAFKKIHEITQDGVHEQELVHVTKLHFWTGLYIRHGGYKNPELRID